MNAAPVPFKPRGGTFGFFLMVIGMFMAILDIQIVASSLPQIQAGISASADEITWVQTAYLIAEVVMIPLSGWLARVMSTRWLFTMSSAGFTVTSLLCANAWSVESLIFFRILQGFIGGAMIPTVFAANYKLFPPARQLVGSIVIGLTATLAPALGPTIGGLLTEHFSWHWLFLANIIPGLIVTISVPLMIDIDQPNWRLFTRIDIPGIVLIAGFLGSLELVLDEGPRNSWFESREILFFAILSVVSAVLLFWRELTVKDPVLELGAFRNRNFTMGCVLTFVLGICMFGQSYILPQVLAGVRGYNSLQIGHVMFVTGAAMFLTAPIAGRVARGLDPRMVLLVGFSLTSIGLFLNAGMTTTVSYGDLFWPQVFRGMGLVMSLVTITTVALGTLPPSMVGGGSGLFNVFRNMGGALGLSIIHTQYDHRYALHLTRMAEDMHTTDQSLMQYLHGLSAHFAQNPAIGDPNAAALQSLVREMQQQSSVMSWDDMFYAMSVMFLCAISLVFLLAKPKAAAIAAH